MKKCPECGNKTLSIVGLGYYEDSIEVECSSCGYAEELEPDGLGEGGMEFVEAQMMFLDQGE